VKTLFILLLTFLCFRAPAAMSVALAWEASPDASVVNYTLYVGHESGKYTRAIPLGLPLVYWQTNAPPPPPSTTTNGACFVSSTNGVFYPVPVVLPSYTNSVPTNTNAAQYGCVYTGLIPATNYFFIVTCNDAAGLESDPSNELQYLTPGMFQLQVPSLRRY
jgi:hypothetical protein